MKTTQEVRTMNTIMLRIFWATLSLNNRSDNGHLRAEKNKAKTQDDVIATLMFCVVTRWGYAIVYFMAINLSQVTNIKWRADEKVTTVKKKM